MRQLIFLEIRALPHRPELDHSETTPTETRPFLKEEREPGGVEPYRERDEKENRRQHDEQHSAHRDVDDSLRNECPSLEDRASQLEERLVVVPHESGPKSVDSHGCPGAEHLTACMHAP